MGDNRLRLDKSLETMLISAERYAYGGGCPMICIDWDPNCPSDCLYDPMWAEDLGEKQEHLHGTELCRRGYGAEPCNL